MQAKVFKKQSRDVASLSYKKMTEEFEQEEPTPRVRFREVSVKGNLGYLNKLTLSTPK